LLLEAVVVDGGIMDMVLAVEVQVVYLLVTQVLRLVLLIL
jgi:hypothetical protein